jgi:rhodanese-related sulfurtransferase
MNNSTIELPINPELPKDGAFDFKIPSYVRRASDFGISIAYGGVGGYVFYLITRLVDKYFMENAGGIAIQPIPFILSGMTSSAIVEVVRLVYDISLHILGKREVYEDLSHFEKISISDHLRHRTWKVIGRVEKLEQDIDGIFSHIFGVRTAKEIRQKHIPDRDLYTMEIVRRAFGEQVFETLGSALPQELGVYLVEACGYTVFGGHLFIWLHGASFLTGIILKVQQVYDKIDLEEIEEEIRYDRAQRVKADCDILAAMYPAEFAKLESTEKGINDADTGDGGLVDVESEDVLDKLQETDVLIEELLDEEQILIEETDVEDTEFPGKEIDLEFDDWLQIFVKPSNHFDIKKGKDILAYPQTFVQSGTTKGVKQSDNSQISDDEEESIKEVDSAADVMIFEVK